MRVQPILRRGILTLLPLAVLLAAATAPQDAQGLLDRLSLLAFDIYQRAAPPPAGGAPVAIVGTDDRSLARFGQWPRTLRARLVDRLAADASVVAFDIDVAEPDRTPPGLRALGGASPICGERRRRLIGTAFLPPRKSDRDAGFCKLLCQSVTIPLYPV